MLFSAQTVRLVGLELELGLTVSLVHVSHVVAIRVRGLILFVRGLEFRRLLVILPQVSVIGPERSKRIFFSLLEVGRTHRHSRLYLVSDKRALQREREREREPGVCGSAVSRDSCGSIRRNCACSINNQHCTRSSLFFVRPSIVVCVLFRPSTFQLNNACYLQSARRLPFAGFKETIHSNQSPTIYRQRMIRLAASRMQMYTD